MLGFLPAGTVEMETEDRKDTADKEIYQYKSSSSDIFPLEKIVNTTSSTSIRNERVTVLKKAMYSMLATMRTRSETGFAVFFEG